MPNSPSLYQDSLDFGELTGFYFLDSKGFSACRFPKPLLIGYITIRYCYMGWNRTQILALMGTLWLGTVGYGFAQGLNPQLALTQYIADNWDVNKGLSSSIINEVKQSKDGYLWAGSFMGLNRFDGANFQLFTPSNVEGLTSITFDAAYESANGTLWFGTTGNGGLTAYQNQQLVHYGSRQGYPNRPVIAITEDPQNSQLWIGTVGYGVFVMDKAKGAFTQAKQLAPLNGQTISALLFDDEGRLWAATENNGLVIAKGNQYQHYTTQNAGLPNAPILSLYKLKTGQVLVGTSKGIYTKTPTGFRLKPNTEKYAVNTLLEDARGTLWFGTTTGLGRITARGIEFVEKLNEIPLYVTSLCYDHEGSLWIGLYRHGLLRLREGKFLNYTYREGLASIAVNGVLAVGKDRFYVGTDNGVVNVIEANGRISTLPTKQQFGTERIRHLAMAPDGSLWIASYKGVLQLRPDGSETFYNTKNGLKDEQARYLWISPDGQVWIGSRAGGIAILNPTTNQFRYLNKSQNTLHSDFVMQIKPLANGEVAVVSNNGGVAILDKNLRIKKVWNTESGMPDNLTFAVYEQVAQKQLWIATGSGLAIVMPNGTINTITSKEGLPSESIFDLVADNKGYLWLSTNMGLSRVAQQEIQDFLTGKNTRIHPQVFTDKDGMASSECTGAVHLCQTPDGRILIPTLGGLSIINPNKIPQNPHKPAVYIERIATEGQSFAPAQYLSQTLSLAQGWRRLNFEFTALSFIAADNVFFKYKLEGFDNEWTLTQERSISYTSLPPGQYTFRVQASNNDGLWNETGASVTLYIKPYFYQYTAFHMLVILLVLATLYGIYRWRIRVINQQKEALELIVQERTAQLNQQNEELHAQRDFIEAQVRELQSRELKINASINSARTIQQAILPPKTKLDMLLRNYFILYRPKDVVSGDFYWLNKIEDELIFVVADCTGHGVPGAFMTLIGNTLLDKIIRLKRITDPAEILTELNEEVQTVLMQRESKNNSGMDVTVVKAKKQDRDSYLITFAGAKHDVLYYDSADDQLKELKGDRKAIGGLQNPRLQFNNHTVVLQKGSVVYTGSDGYEDQNDVRRRKIGRAQFRTLLGNIAAQPLDQQQQALEKYLDQYMKDTEQRDDILLIAVKL